MRVVRDRYRSRVYGRDISEVMLDEVFEKVCFFNDDEHDETHSFTKALKKTTIPLLFISISLSLSYSQ